MKGKRVGGEGVCFWTFIDKFSWQRKKKFVVRHHHSSHSHLCTFLTKREEFSLILFVGNEGNDYLCILETFEKNNHSISEVDLNCMGGKWLGRRTLMWAKKRRGNENEYICKQTELHFVVCLWVTFQNPLENFFNLSFFSLETRQQQKHCITLRLLCHFSSSYFLSSFWRDTLQEQCNLTFFFLSYLFIATSLAIFVVFVILVILTAESQTVLKCN